MAKISARGDKEVTRVKFEDGVDYILTQHGRILIRRPWGATNVLVSKRTIDKLGDNPQTVFEMLVRLKARQTPIKERE
jgi:hypothetical protein